MLTDMSRAWDVCREIQRRNGVSTEADLTVHHLIAIGESFIRLLAEMEVSRSLFRELLRRQVHPEFARRRHQHPRRTSYAHRIHRDIRSFSGEMPLMLNTLVMLDAFTAENGATTWDGTHKRAERIGDEEFHRIASRALGPAGSVLVFNSNVWHAGGDNRTAGAALRDAMFCRPFIKPQFDYPRALGYDRTDWSPHLRQLLGYDSRIPASLDECTSRPSGACTSGTGLTA